MPDLTPNLELEKPTLDEFYDVNVQNRNMDKIDSNLTTLKKQVATHLDKNIATTQGIIRDVSLSGTQTITLPLDVIPKHISIKAIMHGTKKTSNGSRSGSTELTFYNNAAGDSFYINQILLLEDSVGNYATATISAIRKGSIDLSWYINGSGAGLNLAGNSEAYIIVECIYHGGDE